MKKAAKAPLELGADLVGKALFTDLLVAKTRYKGKGKKRSPVDVEAHLNPAGIGMLMVGAGLTMWLMQLRAGVTVWGRGYFVWLDGSKASKDLWTTTADATEAPIAAPTRPVTNPAPKPVQSDYSEPWAYAAALAVWYAQNTETATWFYDGKHERFGIAERKGFLNGGVGTLTSDYVKTMAFGAFQ